MRSIVRKLLFIAMPALACSAVVGAVLVEAWVRLQWDEKKGTPGFFLSDPLLGLRLAPGYDGWFAGTPVKINSLGFRDPREYSLEKGPDTFRILVIGDSVTFGHGALYEATYPRILEQKLAEWRPEVDWQVWNLGVPGLNTSQELAYLREVGPRYAPDLVVIGFYPNDFTGNERLGTPGPLRRARFALQRAMQRNLYSYEFYKRVYLTARYLLLDDEDDWKRLDHLRTEEQLYAKTEEIAARPEQQLTPTDYFDAAAVSTFTCPGGVPLDARGAAEFRSLVAQPGSDHARWLEAVRELQRLHAEGAYRIVFFMNWSPDICHDADRFYDAGAVTFDRAVMDVLGAGGTPAVSSTPRFLHYRPSQMPLAGTHSIGNSNRVKAEALFDYLRDAVLPGIMATRQGTSGGLP